MNQLEVNQQNAIVTLYRQGWSRRRIARELGVDRSAVRRYLAVAGAKPPTNPRTRSEPEVSKPPTPQTGPEPVSDAKPPTDPRTGVLPLGGAGPESLCEPWKEVIEAALASGLSIQRIYQDLRTDHRKRHV